MEYLQTKVHSIETKLNAQGDEMRAIVRFCLSFSLSLSLCVCVCVCVCVVARSLSPRAPTHTA